MDDLALRPAVLDPEAGIALQVIAHLNPLQEPVPDCSRSSTPRRRSPATRPGHRSGRPLTVRVLADGAAAGPEGHPDSTWPSAPVTPGGATLWLERLAPAGSVEARCWSAQRARPRLGLSSPARVVALPDGETRVVAADATLPEELRTGVGPAVAADHLPVSWAADRLALRLTAEGTETDPARV